MPHRELLFSDARRHERSVREKPELKKHKFQKHKTNIKHECTTEVLEKKPEFEKTPNTNLMAIWTIERIFKHVTVLPPSNS